MMKSIRCMWISLDEIAHHYMSLPCACGSGSVILLLHIYLKVTCFSTTHTLLHAVLMRSVVCVRSRRDPAHPTSIVTMK
jgi:hypothetical protein